MLGDHSFGDERHPFNRNGIRIAETLMPAGLRIGPHAHDPGQVCFVLEGEYSEEIGNVAHRLRPGYVQIHAPGELHSNVFPSEENALTLLVSVDRHRWLDVVGKRPIAAEPILNDIAGEIRQELTRGDDVSRAALEGLALLLLSRMARRDCGVEVCAPEWLGDAVAHIEHHYASSITLGTVAAAVGVHRGTLAAAFRKFRSTSVGEYIREVRVRHAIALIRRGVPLADTASLAGFADQAHLGRVLKRIAGVTPGQIRARNGSMPWK